MENDLDSRIQQLEREVAALRRELDALGQDIEADRTEAAALFSHQVERLHQQVTGAAARLTASDPDSIDEAVRELEQRLEALARARPSDRAPQDMLSQLQQYQRSGGS